MPAHPAADRLALQNATWFQAIISIVDIAIRGLDSDRDDDQRLMCDLREQIRLLQRDDEQHERQHSFRLGALKLLWASVETLRADAGAEARLRDLVEAAEDVPPVRVVLETTIAQTGHFEFIKAMSYPSVGEPPRLLETAHAAVLAVGAALRALAPSGDAPERWFHCGRLVAERDI